MHMRIQRSKEDANSGSPNGSNPGSCFILGQFSKPFPSVPSMVRHYTLNRLPIRGAEHMSLVAPVCEQLL